MEQTRKFLCDLHEFSEGYIGIWTPDKRTLWIRTDNIKDELHKIDTLAEKHDVYLNMGLYPQSLGFKQKGKEKDVCGINCLWLDLDVQHELHEKKNLPPDFESAEKLLNETLPPEFEPTYVVNTGHGLQAFWLFKEPWELETDIDRHAAKALSVRLIRAFQFKASTYGWAVDMTPALCQLMRLPGTYNRKDPEDIKEVKIIRETGNKINPDEFEEFLPDNVTERMALDSAQNGVDYNANPLGIIIQEAAEPPAMKLQQLLEVDTKFASSYRKLRDNEFKDASLSTYDMSLARLAKSYGWEDQEVCNLIISFRRENATSQKEFQKALRVDYLNRTIYAAKEEAPQTEANRNIAEITKEIKEEQEHGIETTEKQKQDRKEKTLEELSRGLKIGIARFIKYTGDTPVFELELRDGSRVCLGSISNLIDQNNLRKQLAAHCGIYLSRYKTQAWDQIASAILFCIEEVDPGTDTRDTEILKSWIRFYLSQKEYSEDHEATLLYDKPLKKAGKIYVSGRDVRTTMASYGDKYSAKDFGYIMKSVGCNQEAVHIENSEGKRTTKSLYNVTSILERGNESGSIPKIETPSK